MDQATVASHRLPFVGSDEAHACPLFTFISSHEHNVQAFGSKALANGKTKTRSRPHNYRKWHAIER